MNEINTSGTRLQRPLIVSLVCMNGIVFCSSCLISLLFAFSLAPVIITLVYFILFMQFVVSYLLMLGSTCQKTRVVGRLICLTLSGIFVIFSVIGLSLLHFNFVTFAFFFFPPQVNLLLLKESTKDYWK
jgi:hypothetical protein